MAYTNETLAGCAIILTVLAIVIVTFSVNCGKDVQDDPRGNFLERATTPALCDVYRVKKIKRNGKDLTYVMKIGGKDNLNSNKNHPTRIPLGTSPQK